MQLTSDGQYLFFGSGVIGDPKHITKFSVDKNEVVEKLEDPALEEEMHSIALSLDSSSLYVGTRDKLLQLSLVDGKVIQSRNIKERPEMQGAVISAMRVTRDNQYLVTCTMYVGNPEKGTEEYLSGKKYVYSGGPVCVW